MSNEDACNTNKLNKNRSKQDPMNPNQGATNKLKLMIIEIQEMINAIFNLLTMLFLH
jgi:hypothetical protein